MGLREILGIMLKCPNGDGDNYDDNEEKVLESELMKSVMSTSFLEPRKKGSGEGQSKYALLGQWM